MSKLALKILQSDLIRSTWRRVVHLWKPMAAWTLLIWALVAVILAPVSSAVLRLQFFRSGELVVGNQQLLSWLFTPVGLGYMLLGSLLALTGWILRFAGIFRIVTDNMYGRTIDFQNILQRIIGRSHVLFRLCLFIVAAGLLLLLPLAAGLGFIYELFLETHDINYYLSATPIEWHIAVIISITWLFIWLLGVVYITARCLFALPAYLHSQKSIGESVIYAWEIGYEKSKDNLKSILSVAGFWIIVRFIADVTLLAISIWSISWISNHIGSLRIIALATAFYVIVSLAIDAIISFLGFSYVSTLITKLFFRDVSELTNAPVPPATHKFKRLASFLKNLLQPKWLSATVGIVVIVSFFMSGYMLEQIPHPNSDKSVNIAAHRAGPSPAPENTLQALDLSIQAGADLAEIDVQLSRDSAVVVAHDFDLMRIANHPARISETDFVNLQKILHNQHAKDNLRQHRFHTLDDFLEASRNKIKLMIELKQPGAVLARSVITTLRQEAMEDEVIITSMDLEAVRRVKKMAPEITVGYVSAFSLGDLSQLPVELLVINHRSVTPRLTADAHQQDLEVYAWTVNRTNVMATMIERNVDGIITDKPELGIQVRKEMQELSAAERLLLQFHQLMK